jgi:hypothetical protein
MTMNEYHHDIRMGVKGYKPWLDNSIGRRSDKAKVCKMMDYYIEMSNRGGMIFLATYFTQLKLAVQSDRVIPEFGEK